MDKQQFREMISSQATTEEKLSNIEIIVAEIKNKMDIYEKRFVTKEQLESELRNVYTRIEEANKDISVIQRVGWSLIGVVLVAVIGAVLASVGI